MKTKLIFAALALVAIYLFSGCATRTADEVAIQRFVPRQEAEVKAAVDKFATARNYHETTPNTYQRILIRERDPILGLVPISEKPEVALECRVSYRNNQNGTMLTAIPCSVHKKPFGDGYNTHFLPPSSSDRAEIVAFIDAAVADLAFTAGIK